MPYPPKRSPKHPNPEAACSVICCVAAVSVSAGRVGLPGGVSAVEARAVGVDRGGGAGGLARDDLALTAELSPVIDLARRWPQLSDGKISHRWPKQLG